MTKLRLSWLAAGAITVAAFLAQEGSAGTVPWSLAQSAMKVNSLHLLSEAMSGGLAAKADAAESATSAAVRRISRHRTYAEFGRRAVR